MTTRRFNPLDPPGTWDDEPDDGYTWLDLKMEAAAVVLAGLMTFGLGLLGFTLWDMIGGGR